MAKNANADSAIQTKEDAWIIRGEGGREKDLHLHEQLSVDADIVYDRLDEGAHLHCCESKGLAASAARVLAAEASLRSEDIQAKLAEWSRKGQLHSECMCQRASEAQAELASKDGAHEP